MKFAVGFTVLSLAAFAQAHDDAEHAHEYHVDQDYERVTCGSSFKLAHAESDHRLHSQAVNYASGSGQRSVTALPHPDDPESLWTVLAGHSAHPCKRAEPIKCNATIRLKHLSTGRFLHSHTFSSPISQNQEVSAFPAPGDAGDDWVIHCEEPGAHGQTDYWEREKKVSLRHVDTASWLWSNKELSYGRPIAGHLEVAAVKNKDGEKSLWIAKEGIYFAEEEEDAKTEL